MRKTFVQITTADTGKTYILPGKDVPQLFEVTIQLRGVTEHGMVKSSVTKEQQFYYERQSFVDVALLPKSADDKPPSMQPRRIEDMIAEILAHMGIFPS